MKKNKQIRRAHKLLCAPLKFPSELRLDLVSKDWVVIATGRAKRPETFKRERKTRKETPKKDCPFCKPENLKYAKLAFLNGIRIKNKNIKNWTTIVIPNRFPAFLPSSRLVKEIEGNLYQTVNAVGFHEVVITKDHKKSLAQLPIGRIKEVIDIYQDRYLELMKKPCVNNISIFHNHGPEAGASIFHPHSQIITTPLVDVDSSRAVSNSQRYFKAHKKCLACQMAKWEMKARKRIVFENKDFLVLCPFASKDAFEVIISPKKHQPYFEKITESEKWQLAEAFKMALGKLFKGLNDPAYNFYLHTSPCDGKKYDYYHWHWTILPKTSIWAGFELGTGMEISTIEPEKAAEYLRKQ
jgi:UDPglucose--hexose-1-phosphate uridylyltransferase